MKTLVPLLAILVAANVGFAQQDLSPQEEQHVRDSQMDMLEHDLRFLNMMIKMAEDEMFDYMFQHDIIRSRIRAEVEEQSLRSLIRERVESQHALIVLEATHPFLTDTNVVTTGPEADSLRSEHSQLKRTTSALEAAEEKRKLRNSYSALRDSRLIEHYQANLERLEASYRALADKLHGLTMKDRLKTLQNKPSDATR